MQLSWLLHNKQLAKVKTLLLCRCRYSAQLVNGVITFTMQRRRSNPMMNRPLYNYRLTHCNGGGAATGEGKKIVAGP